MTPPTMFYIGAKKWPGISKLVEECGEVLQVCGKLIAAKGETAHFDGSDLNDLLHDEIADVLAACSFVIDFCKLDKQRIVSRAIAKGRLFEQWQREQDDTLS